MEASDIPAILKTASRVFGVAQSSPCKPLEPTEKAMRAAALRLYRAAAEPGDSFAVRVKRTDKTFPVHSTELESRIGRHVQQATHAPVNLSHPDLTIALRIHEGSAYLEGPKIPGPGGLPLGVTGKALTLFSGGIDSPVAAWLLNGFYSLPCLRPCG